MNNLTSWVTGFTKVCAFLLILWAPHAQADSEVRVTVIATLHRFHESVPGYSYQALRELLERARPDVLAVELTESDLRNRVEQAFKTEYNAVVFPYLKEHPIHVIALEPDGESVRQSLQTYRKLEQVIESSETLGPIANGLSDLIFERVKQRWHSAADVNSDTTDLAFEIKHEAAKFIYGSSYYDGWEQWNRWMLERLKQGLHSQRVRPIHVVVLVGAEHGYWFRRALRSEPGFRLRPMPIPNP